MSKKGKRGALGNLGKSLIRDRFGPKLNNKRRNEPSMLHTAEINDGYDWGRLNLQSVTEESSFQEFLSTAELAGTEFHAEKLNVKFVNSKSSINLMSKAEKEKLLESQKKNKDLLKIPRRPKWDSSMNAHELQGLEKEEFLKWRRNLAMLQEANDLMLTPFEKNLEFWRQLWRVVERSDVIVQIVDARNPLLFRSEDLELYVKEVNADKLNMILINKSDFLTDEQREAWAKYFTDINVRVVFFSAKLAEEMQEKNKDKTKSKVTNGNDNDTVDENSSDESLYKSDFESEVECECMQKKITIVHVNEDGSPTVSNIEVETDKQIEIEAEMIENLKISTIDSQHEMESEIIIPEDEMNERVVNSSKLLDRDELINLFKTLYSGKTYMNDVTTIGMVGYPNVGKSSTINALLMGKKVSVSATPGKTKHFQTLYLDAGLMLCDCPGLVTPSFISTKAEMILNGILPIDQMREHVPPITLLTTLIPRYLLEIKYGLMLPEPLEGEDPDRAPTAEEFLNAHGRNRGFMTQNGQPDNARSARYVLKDFVNGKLLYCVAPPTNEQESFNKFPPRDTFINYVPMSNYQGMYFLKNYCSYPQHESSGVHFKGNLRRQYASQLHSLASNATSMTDSTQASLLVRKPSKVILRHENKQKRREKTRRLYAHLDQH